MNLSGEYFGFVRNQFVIPFLCHSHFFFPLLSVCNKINFPSNEEHGEQNTIHGKSFHLLKKVIKKFKPF